MSSSKGNLIIEAKNVNFKNSLKVLIGPESEVNTFCESSAFYV